MLFQQSSLLILYSSRLETDHLWVRELDRNVTRPHYYLDCLTWAQCFAHIKPSWSLQPIKEEITVAAPRVKLVCMH